MCFIEICSLMEQVHIFFKLHTRNTKINIKRVPKAPSNV